MQAQEQLDQQQQQQQQQAAMPPSARSPMDPPLCTIEDAANLANHFINQYLTACRAVTGEEAINCLSVFGQNLNAAQDRIQYPEGKPMSEEEMMADAVKRGGEAAKAESEAEVDEAKDEQGE